MMSAIGWGDSNNNSIEVIVTSNDNNKSKIFNVDKTGFKNIIYFYSNYLNQPEVTSNYRINGSIGLFSFNYFVSKDLLSIFSKTLGVSLFPDDSNCQPFFETDLWRMYKPTNLWTYSSDPSYWFQLEYRYRLTAYSVKKVIKDVPLNAKKIITFFVYIRFVLKQNPPLDYSIWANNELTSIRQSITELPCAEKGILLRNASMMLDEYGDEFRKFVYPELFKMSLSENYFNSVYEVLKSAEIEAEALLKGIITNCYNASIAEIEEWLRFIRLRIKKIEQKEVVELAFYYYIPGSDNEGKVNVYLNPPKNCKIIYAFSNVIEMFDKTVTSMGYDIALNLNIPKLSTVVYNRICSLYLIGSETNLYSKIMQISFGVANLECGFLQKFYTTAPVTSSSSSSSSSSSQNSVYPENEILVSEILGEAYEPTYLLSNSLMIEYVFQKYFNCSTDINAFMAALERFNKLDATMVIAAYICFYYFHERGLISEASSKGIFEKILNSIDEFTSSEKGVVIRMASMWRDTIGRLFRTLTYPKLFKIEPSNDLYHIGSVYDILLRAKERALKLIQEVHPNRQDAFDVQTWLNFIEYRLDKIEKKNEEVELPCYYYYPHRYNEGVVLNFSPVFDEPCYVFSNVLEIFDGTVGFDIYGRKTLKLNIPNLPTLCQRFGIVRNLCISTIASTINFKKPVPVINQKVANLEYQFLTNEI